MMITSSGNTVSHWASSGGLWANMAGSCRALRLLSAVAQCCLCGHVDVVDTISNCLWRHGPGEHMLGQLELARLGVAGGM